MPRKARRRSSTDIYHVMLRGINGQIIFEDNEDYQKFIQTIQQYQEICGFQLYAYTLMPNHIHLLIQEGKEDLGTIFKRIGTSYVYWYNLKYKRRGHLFQDRYKSEPVEDESYFLTVLRYIHQNPIKAGIEKDIAKYPWSSYKEYINGDSICNTIFPLGLFAEDNQSAIELFKQYNNQQNNDQCLEYEEIKRLNDSEATQIIKEVAMVKKTTQVQNFEKEKRNNIIRELRNKGLSIRQIERLTGVSFGVIRRV